MRNLVVMAVAIFGSTTPALAQGSGSVALAPPQLSAKNAPKAALGLAFRTENNRINVADVMPGGTGDRMGVRKGDVITHIGGKRIHSLTRLTAAIGNLQVGDTVRLTVKRRAETIELTGTTMARRW